MLLRPISNACAVRATYSFLYVDHGLSQSLRFLPKGPQPRGTRLELSGEEVEEHQMMIIVHRYRWSLVAVILHLLVYHIIFIVSTAVCCVFWL